MQKVSYIFSYICCLLRQRLIKILIFRKKFRRGPNYCSDFFFFTMTKVATSKNLSNFHVVSYWSEWRFMEIVRELLSLERCPESMRENLLKGQEKLVNIHL